MSEEGKIEKMGKEEIMEKFPDEEGNIIMEIKERTPEATIYRTDRDILDYPLPYDNVEKLQHPDRDREIEDLFSISIGEDVEEVSIAHHEILVRKTPEGHWEEIDKTVLSLLKEIPAKEK